MSDKFSKLEKYLLERNSHSSKRCKKCGAELVYSKSKGILSCEKCGYTEKDNYGKIKTLLENNPDLSKPELAMILNIPLKDVNLYFDNENHLLNPKY